MGLEIKKKEGMIIVKNCFVISAIGEEGSPVRLRADKVLRHIIKPVTDNYEYDTFRADEVADPGLISKSILQNLIQSDLVIADLSGHNPNVFYELAVRHAFGKPIIQIIDKNDKIPFDVFDMRTISYSLDLDDVQEAKERLAASIEALPADGLMKTPISEVTSLLSISETASSDSAIYELVQEVQRIPDYLNALEHRIAGRITEIASSTGKNSGSMEDRLGMMFFEKMLDDPSKADQMLGMINNMQNLTKLPDPRSIKKR